MRRHLANAAYGVLDYAVYPIGMLMVAPIVLHKMGTAQYGVWTISTAAVSIGSIIASGFGDANIQHVARQRGAGNRDALIRTVRSTISINLILGTIISLVAWALVPYTAHHIAPHNVALQHDCFWSLCIASGLIWLRAMESVCVSTQRAFERYGPAVRISIITRVLSLVVAAGLAFVSQHVAVLVFATAMFSLVGTWVQFVHLRRLLCAGPLTPIYDGETFKALFAFGAYSWLQAACGVLFSQADRLLLGVSMGAVTVASYALCTQMAQPIYGFAASGLHFLFPYLAGRNESHAASSLSKAVVAVFLYNVVFVVASTAGLLTFGPRILRLWAGEEIARNSASILPLIVLGSALLGLNVTGTYSLLAFGRVQIVTWLNLAGGIAMMLVIALLVPRTGIYGMAVARLCYGALTLLLYVPLIQELRKGHAMQTSMRAYEEA